MVKAAQKPVVEKEEQKYREELFPDVKKIVKKNALCTSCNTSVRELVAKGKPRSHPFLETLLCEKCDKFYGDGEFSVDEEDGSDKYCRWCGQGGTLYLCSACTAGFCKKCIKRNLPRAVWKDVEDDDWKCLACNVKPLYELRALSWAAQEYASTIEKGNASKKRKAKELSDEESSNGSTTKKSKPNASSDDEKEEKPVKGKTLRKSSREKKSKSKSAPGDGSRSSDESTPPVEKSKTPKPDAKDKLRVKQMKKAREEMGAVIDDLVKIVDISKKRATEFRKKKMTPSKLNSLDALSMSSEHMITLLQSVEEATRDLRLNFESFLSKFKETAQEMNEEAEKDAEPANGGSVVADENGDVPTSPPAEKDEESAEKDISNKSDEEERKSVEKEESNVDDSTEKESPTKRDESTTD
ncbi:Hypothetical protein NTJ_08429 [Nesidiocoris tenuis]|uniref:PHD-type domain-containing protein n=1 Tax=Nesidiocoris tenuis TaxID=355587 RepID=A0ABN7AUI8_9HEMI|nr:Hypothetical protein NTJ_08429 [Nesidiocoris tenuis]